MSKNRKRYQQYTIPLGILLILILSACVFRRPIPLASPKVEAEQGNTLDTILLAVPDSPAKAIDTISLRIDSLSATNDSLRLRDSIFVDSLRPSTDSLTVADSTSAVDSLQS